MAEQPRRTVESTRLCELTLACPDCGARMAGTGRMHYSPTIRRWLVEYECPADREIHEIWTPETDRLTDELGRGAS